MGVRDEEGQGFQMAAEPRVSKQVRAYIFVFKFLDSTRKTRILD
jgi:hypothetical protein